MRRIVVLTAICLVLSAVSVAGIDSACAAETYDDPIEALAAGINVEAGYDVDISNVDVASAPMTENISTLMTTESKSQPAERNDTGSDAAETGVSVGGVAMAMFVAPEPMITDDIKTDTIVIVKDAVKDDVKTDVKNDIKTEAAAEVKEDVKEVTVVEIKGDVKKDVTDRTREDLKAETKEDVKQDIKTDVKGVVQESVKADIQAGKI